MSKQSFLAGTLILVGASLLTRIIGFVYRILLSRFIGAEGMGIFQMVFPTYTVLYALITAGLPVAISKMVAEAEAHHDEQRIAAIMRASVVLVLLFSAVGGLLLYVAAPYLSHHLLKEPRTYLPMLAMLPILPVVALTSILRGYYQGRQNMIPSSASQILESLVRLSLAVALTLTLMPYGVEVAAAGVMLAMLGGEAAGLLTLLLWKRRSPAPGAPAPAVRGVARQLLQFSIPVTMSRLAGTLSYFFEPIVVAQSLALAGYLSATATAEYGKLAGMAIPLLLFPTVLTFALSISLVPAISEAAAQGNLRRIRQRLHQAMRLALVVGAPFCLILYVWATPLSILLYNDATVAPLLQMMAPFSIFLYYQGPLNAALQGMGKVRVAMFNSIVGAVMKLLCIFLLASRPGIGIRGAALAVVLSFVLVTLLHWFSISRSVGNTVEWGDWGKVAVSIAITYLAMQLFSARTLHLGMAWDLLWAGALSLGTYLLMLALLGLIKREDLARLPWVGRFFGPSV